ncbi:hypothetical protein GCM10020256_69740 [Streptomyces thermocoprophilus]
MVASLLFQQSGELKSGRSGPDDDVVAHHGRDANGRASEVSEIAMRPARTPDPARDPAPAPAPALALAWPPGTAPTVMMYTPLT